MEEQIKRGRRLLLTIIALMLAISLATIVFYNTVVGPERVTQQIVRFALTALLSFFLYKGHGWARWVTVLLTAIAAVTSFIAGASIFLLGDLSGIFFLVMGAVYAFCAGSLAFSRSIVAFINHQRASVV